MLVEPLPLISVGNKWVSRIRYKNLDTETWFYFRIMPQSRSEAKIEYFKDETWLEQIEPPIGVVLTPLNCNSSINSLDYRSMIIYHTNEYLLTHDGFSVFHQSPYPDQGG